MFILGVVSATFFCLSLAKMFDHSTERQNSKETSDDESIPGTPGSTSDEEEDPKNLNIFEEELSSSEQGQQNIIDTDVRTIIENYTPKDKRN